MGEPERCQACGRPLGAERYEGDYCDEGCHSVRFTELSYWPGRDNRRGTRLVRDPVSGERVTEPAAAIPLNL